MNLGEKIEEILSILRESNSSRRIKVYYTSSEDHHKKKEDDIFGTGNGVAEYMLSSYLNTFKKYGECESSDSKGQIIRIVDIKLI